MNKTNEGGGREFSHVAEALREIDGAGSAMERLSVPYSKIVDGVPCHLFLTNYETACEVVSRQDDDNLLDLLPSSMDSHPCRGNIRTMICLCPDKRNYQSNLKDTDSFNFFSIEDEVSAQILPIAEECIKIINKSFSEKKSVLIHCLAGVSRSASVVWAYLMSQGMSYDAAFKHLLERRSCVGPNVAFRSQLRILEREFRGEANQSISIRPVYEETNGEQVMCIFQTDQSTSSQLYASLKRGEGHRDFILTSLLWLGCDFPRRSDGRSGSYHLYMGDKRILQIDIRVKEASDIFNNALVDGYDVVVYCKDGVSDSTFLILAWLITCKNYTYERVLAMVPDVETILCGEYVERLKHYSHEHTI